MADVPGLEPRTTESKSVVLPLHHTPINLVPLLGLEPRELFLLREATLPICPQGHLTHSLECVY